MDQGADLGEPEAGRPEELFQAFEGACRGILGCGEALVEAHAPGFPVDEDEVREGPTDVDAHTVAVT